MNDIIAMRLWEKMWGLRHLYDTDPSLFWKLVAMEAVWERFAAPLFAFWWWDIAFLTPSVRTLGGRIPDILRRVQPVTIWVVKKQ